MVIATILLTGASLTASVFFLQVAVLPLVFKHSRTIQRKMIFSNCINYPRNLDYENPSSCNIIGGRNFCVQFHSKADNCPIKLGAWHMVPRSMFQDVFIIKDSIQLEARLHKELKTTQNPIVLYCHGNSNHRASPERIQIYKTFQELNFHVITFDYRGYGDSSRVRPTERGVVEDLLAVYRWLHESLNKKNRPLVIVWGHSLGTAVAANMSAYLSELCQEDGKPTLPLPDAMVLEAPFNNLMDEIESHPFSKLVSWLPYYKESFVKPFVVSSEYTFNTDQYLCRVPTIPILILHSKADKIVPFRLAVKVSTCLTPILKFPRGHWLNGYTVVEYPISSQPVTNADATRLKRREKGRCLTPVLKFTQLYDKIVTSRGQEHAPLVFHAFEKDLRLGHNNLLEASNFVTIIKDFLNVVKNRTSL